LRGFNHGFARIGTEGDSELSFVGLGDELLERDNFHQPTVLEIWFEGTRDVEVAECPSGSSEDEVSLLVSASALSDCFHQADHLERNFLLGRAADLLPLQGDEDAGIILGGDGVNSVLAAA